MDARRHTRAALAIASALAAAVAAMAAPASAGWHGGGRRAGSFFRPAPGLHAFGGYRGWGVGARARGLPPIAGVIHERAGMRPYLSAYGHTTTALRYGAFGRPGGAFYGHTGTGLRYAAGRGRFLGRYGGYGGFGGGLGFGAGFYGAPGVYGDAGSYGRPGVYGQGGTYGQDGTYGTTATQSVYGNGGLSSYRSERPLAARFSEPPLAPSPYAPYSPEDRYAYAASEDVGPGPRVLRIHGGARSGCGCEGASSPTFYRYGVGTAY